MTQPEPDADPRPVWDPDTSLAAVREAFATAAGGLGAGNSDILPLLLSPLVDTFQMQVERLRDELESTRRQVPGAPTDAQRAALEAESRTIEQKLDAFIQMADTAKEEYRHHTGVAWEPPEEDDEPDAPHDAPVPHDAAANRRPAGPEAETAAGSHPDPSRKIPY